MKNLASAIVEPQLWTEPHGPTLTQEGDFMGVQNIRYIYFTNSPPWKL